MISYVGLFAAFVSVVLLAFADKRSSADVTSDSDVIFFCFFKTLLCALFAILCLPFSAIHINTSGVVIALFAGIFHAASVILIMQALKNTLAVYVNLFMGAGVVMPSIIGVIFFGQSMTWLKALCLILLVMALAFTLNAQMGMKVKLSLLLPMFLCYGMFMSMQGIFPKCCEDGSGAMFSAVAYGFSAVLLGLMSVSKRKGRQRFTKSTYLLGFVAAVLNLVINLLLTNLSATFDAIIVFPTVHGLKLVTITLLSSVIWKEKISGKQILGSLLAIICVCVLAI